MALETNSANEPGKCKRILSMITRNGRLGAGAARDGRLDVGREAALRRYGEAVTCALYSFNYIVVMGLDESVNYSRAVYVLIGSNGSDEKV